MKLYQGDKMKASLIFDECEHNEDLRIYVSDIQKSGGKIFNSSVDTEEETGIVCFEIEDKSDFLKRFKETESYDFSNLS